MLFNPIHTYEYRMPVKHKLLFHVVPVEMKILLHWNLEALVGLSKTQYVWLAMTQKYGALKFLEPYGGLVLFIVYLFKYCGPFGDLRPNQLVKKSNLPTMKPTLITLKCVEGKPQECGNIWFLHFSCMNERFMFTIPTLFDVKLPAITSF